MDKDAPLRPIIKRGRVVYTLPEINLYAVQPLIGLRYTKEVAYEYAVDVSSRTSASGAASRSGGSYFPGDEVLVLFLTSADVNQSQSSALTEGLLGYIIAPALFHPDKGTLPSNHRDKGFLDVFANQARNATLAAIDVEQAKQNRSYGRPLDITAGDFCESNMCGGYISLSMARSMITASARCGISMSGLDNGVDVTAEIFHKTADALHDAMFPVWNLFHIIERRARTLSEGLGAHEDPLKRPESDGEELVKPQKDDQQGIFRQTIIAGALVEGRLSVTANPVKEYKGGEVMTPDEPALMGFSSSHKAYDGYSRSDSVKSIGLRRGPYVLSPRELATEENDPDAPKPLKPVSDWTAQTDIPEDEQADYASLLMKGRDDWNRKRYFQELDGRPKAWKINDSSPDFDKVETSLDPLPEDETSYKTPCDLEVLDPLNMTEKLKLRTLLSRLELDETGAMVIHDGFGSEIKMHRGHITIAPALDCVIRPGRSVVTFAPKDAVLRAGELIEVSSDTSDVLVKGEKDVKVLSGNSGEGSLILENRARKDYKRDSDKRKSPGVVLKSLYADLDVTAPNVRMGLYNNSDESSSGREGPPGTLLLDAGKGSMFALADKMSISLNETLLAGVGNTLLNMNASSFAVAVDTFGVAATTVDMGEATGALSYPILRKDGPSSKKVDVSVPTTNLRVNGDVNAVEGTFRKNFTTANVSAVSVNAQSGYFGNGSDTSGVSRGKGPTSINNPSSDVVFTGVAAVTADGVKRLKELCGRDAPLTALAMKLYGFEYDVDNTYFKGRLTETLNQRMLRESGKADMWVTGADVKTPDGDKVTKPWPGDVELKMDSVKDLKREELGPFPDSYIINRRKK